MLDLKTRQTLAHLEPTQSSPMTHSAKSFSTPSPLELPRALLHPRATLSSQQTTTHLDILSPPGPAVRSLSATHLRPPVAMQMLTSSSLNSKLAARAPAISSRQRPLGALKRPRLASSLHLHRACCEDALELPLPSRGCAKVGLPCMPASFRPARAQTGGQRHPRSRNNNRCSAA